MFSDNSVCYGYRELLVLSNRTTQCRTEWLSLKAPCSLTAPQIIGPNLYTGPNYGDFLTNKTVFFGNIAKNWSSSRTHTHTHTRTHARTHARTRTHAHAHTHTHTYTHTHTHTHTLLKSKRKTASMFGGQSLYYS